MEKSYTYMFIREDLSIPQLIVQSSHAAWDAGSRFNKPHGTPHMVLIGVKSQEHLKQTADYLEQHGIEFEMFYEPDVEEYTAVASQPVSGETRKLFKHFRLFRR